MRRSEVRTSGSSAGSSTTCQIGAAKNSRVARDANVVLCQKFQTDDCARALRGVKKDFKMGDARQAGTPETCCRADMLQSRLAPYY